MIMMTIDLPAAAPAAAAAIFVTYLSMDRYKNCHCPFLIAAGAGGGVLKLGIWQRKWRFGC